MKKLNELGSSQSKKVKQTYKEEVKSAKEMLALANKLNKKLAEMNKKI